MWNANYLPKIRPEFGWNHGTSLSAPIAAGIAALVLSAHPDLSSRQVINAIKNSSSKSSNPDNLYGWGVPDAEKAVSYFGPSFSNTPILKTYKNKLEIKTYVFSSYGLIKSSVDMYVLKNNNPKEETYKMKEIENNYYSSLINLQAKEDAIKIWFKAKDDRGNTTKFPSGILGEYFIIQKINVEFKILNYE